MRPYRQLLSWLAFVLLLVSLQALDQPLDAGSRRLRNELSGATDHRALWLLLCGGAAAWWIWWANREVRESCERRMSNLSLWALRAAERSPDQPLPDPRPTPEAAAEAASEAAAGVEAAGPYAQILQRLRTVKQRYDHLLEERSRVADALRGMQEGIIAFDSRLQLLLINDAAKGLLGVDLPRVGRPMVELIRQPQVIDLIRRAQESQTVHEAVLAVDRLTKRQLRLRATPLTDQLPPKPPVVADLSRPAGLSVGSGVLLLISDVTRLSQLESMRRDFTANVSHELKTPLAAIQAYTETLLIGALDDPDANRHFVEEISRQADRLNRLIHDLLQLARLDAQPDRIAVQPINLWPLVADVVEQHRPLAAAKSITLRHPRQPVVVAAMAEREAVQTILGNLISNAIRYNHPGGEVDIDFVVGEREVTLNIRDTGFGIPADEHDRIFERFYRIDKARSIEAGGTGLGLAIVKHLVQQLGGSIKLDSRVGVGSSFAVILPRAS